MRAILKPLLEETEIFSETVIMRIIGHRCHQRQTPEHIIGGLTDVSTLLKGLPPHLLLLYEPRIDDLICRIDDAILSLKLGDQVDNVMQSLFPHE